MDKKSVTERLNALATLDAKRTKAARLRDVIGDVESALASGVPRTDILETLNKLGLGMSIQTFDGTLKRIRAKQRAIADQAKTVSQTYIKPAHINQPESKPLKREAQQNEESIPSHDPSDLDSIIGSTPDLDALSKHAKKNRKTK